MSLNHIKTISQGLKDKLNIGCETFECAGNATFDSNIEFKADVLVDGDCKVNGEVSCDTLLVAHPTGYVQTCGGRNFYSFPSGDCDILEYDENSIIGTPSWTCSQLQQPGSFGTVKTTWRLGNTGANTIQLYLRCANKSVNMCDPISLIGLVSDNYTVTYEATFQTRTLTATNWYGNVVQRLVYGPTNSASQTKEYIYTNNTNFAYTNGSPIIDLSLDTNGTLKTYNITRFIVETSTTTFPPIVV